MEPQNVEQPGEQDNVEIGAELVGVERRALQPAEALAQIQQTGRLADAKVAGLFVLQGNFEQEIIVERCDFERITIANATFAKRVTFGKCQLRRGQFGQEVTFAEGLALRGCNLKHCAFNAVVFQGGLKLDNSEASGNLRFDNCHFNAGLKTWATRFDCWVEFQGCEFKGVADFRSFDATQGFQALDCKFHEDVLFRGSMVAKRFDLGRSYFAKMLDLSKAKLHDFAYLELIETGEQTRFAFQNGIFDRLRLKIETIDNRLLSECEKRHADAMMEFGLLKRNFEGQHQYEEEDWAFYRFKINQRRSKAESWLRPWQKATRFLDWLFLDIGCGYGAKPFRAVQSAAAIIVSFAIIYAMNIAYFTITRPPISRLPMEDWINRGVYGLLTSISVFTAGFSGDHFQSTGGWILVPIAIEALLGTLLLGLFIVAFSRKVIR